MSRAEAAGDQRLIGAKLAAKYDNDAEAEVIGWFRDLIGENLQPGMREMEKQLRNGIALVKLAIVIRDKTANCPPNAKKMKMKPNTLAAPFKQMENITTFVNFCEKYGVQKTNTFQTVDLFEGRNMPQVLNCIITLGTECQRHGFGGPVIGSRPVEKNVREFTEDQLKAGQSIIGLQAGTNKCASQSGMSMGAVRHVGDIKSEDMDKRGHGVIGLQAGSNKGASQSGMSMGGVRHVSDIRCDDMDKSGQGVIGLQMGSNKGASQSGMSMGSIRHVSDISVEKSLDSGTIGLQMGSNKGASQSGMSMGGVRHGGDIAAGPMDQRGQGVINLQYGTTEGANQQGMSMGGRRNITK